MAVSLSKNNQFLIDKLEEGGLGYLVTPVTRMIMQDKVGTIKVHGNSWKQIMRDAYYESPEVLERTLLAYLAHYGIFIENKKRTDLRDSKERVKKHRKKLQEQGYKTLSCSVSKSDYIRINMAKEYLGARSYADLLHRLISMADIPHDFISEYEKKARLMRRFRETGGGYKYSIEDVKRGDTP